MSNQGPGDDTAYLNTIAIDIAKITTVRDMPSQRMFVAFCGSLCLIKAQATTPPTQGNVLNIMQRIGRSHQAQETCSCDRSSFSLPVTVAPHSRQNIAPLRITAWQVLQE